ncbi:hypothetical protein [Lactobacillus ultunensis]|uniref:GW domain-containing protein n=1 Tax=Lactobacillus ultunensis DSM 16047 TaxID=525365 RepID=C2EKT8_9LACO|nr:hypothetical protein [Lactobacillus ultunensis]EEJ72795.1 hypothetical protein HMPREF0548_0256 [Lactobacillus ultunensis DSM 16047]KRL83141.1 hypothetical protein FC57_GL000135 [Lactobacillus ultunensis DSM 16047]
MLKKFKISFVLACTLMLSIFFIKPQSVLARSLRPFQTKMINGESYGIYEKLTRKGPRVWMASTTTFRYGNYQASIEKKVGRTKYDFVWIDGHRAGWVNQRAFLRSKIAVVHDISLVKNPDYDFPTRDAINFATDASGTVIEPSKVKVSKSKITSNKASKYRVKYSYGKAHAYTTVRVRKNINEGLAHANKTPQSGESASSWFKHYKTSGNWGKGASYAPETKPHTIKSGNFKLKTYFYQLATLSQGNSFTGMVGPLPEGMAVSNGLMYATMYNAPQNTRAHIVAYRFNQIPNRYIMQKLPWLPWRKFLRLAPPIKVSPLIKTGHGQAFGATNKYLYVIANNHLLRNCSDSEELMQISKQDLQIKKIWTFKIWNGNSNDGRYVHNAVFVNDKKFIAEYHSATNHRFEYWEVTRHGNSWKPVEIGATKGEFMRNDSPVQRMAYNRKKKQIYLAFNDYLFKLKRNGKVLDSAHFHTGREFEGICVNDGYLYAELAQRPELLRQKIK